MIAWFEWQSTQLVSVAWELSAPAPKKASMSMALAVLTLFTVEPPFALNSQAGSLKMHTGFRVYIPKNSVNIELCK